MRAGRAVVGSLRCIAVGNPFGVQWLTRVRRIGLTGGVRIVAL